MDGIFISEMKKNIKKYLKIILDQNIFSEYYYLAIIRVKILNKIEYTNNKVFKIKHLNDLNKNKNKNKKILDGYTYKSKSQKNLLINVPDLNLYIFEDVIVNSRSSTIIEGRNLYYEAINENERFNEGHIKYHSKKIAVIEMSETEKIEEGFFLAGNGSYNWYHWMIEILPKMMYYQEYYSNTILVDESCREIKSMADSLYKFTKDLNIRIIYLEKDKSYKVKKLFYINEVNKLMYNILNPKIKNELQYYFRKSSLLLMRNILSSDFNNDICEKPRIYLQRKNTHRIAKNENEIITFLKNKNFNTLDLSKLNLSEQIIAFNNAQILIGTSGAAWTNMLFCQPNFYAIIFMPSNFKEYAFYEELSEMLDGKVTYLYYENGNNEHHSSDFLINLLQLETLIKNYENTASSTIS